MKKISTKYLLTLACATFLVSGLFNGAIGPVLRALSIQSNSSLSAIGGVITFLFLGALIAQIVGGPIADNLGLKNVLVAAFLLLSAGIFGFSQSHSLPMVFFFFLIAGLGQGFMNLGVNLLVSITFPEKSTSYLNLLHFFFGLGAVSGPALVSLVIRLHAPAIAVHWIASALFLVITLLYILVYENKKPAKLIVPESAPVQKTSLYRSPLLWTVGFMLLVYVGVEYGLGSWSTTLMGVTAGMSIQNGALVTSAYWGLFTLGRLSGAFISQKLSIQKLLTLAIFLALGSGVAFSLLMRTPAGVIITLVAIGLCLGPIFPTSVAFITRSFPQDQGKAFGLVGAMSSIGGLSLPLVDGILLENKNSVGFALFNLSILVAIAVFFLISLHFSKRHSTPGK